METKQKSNHAMAAAAIRKELKQIFGQTRFSVRSESYSGGDAVRISWEDGPTAEEVDNIVNKYQYGHFDGMIDMYEYSNSRKDIPQTKYVCTTRTMSDATRDAIIKEHNATFCEEGQIKDLQAYNEDAQCWNSSLVYRKFNKLSLAAKQ